MGLNTVQQHIQKLLDGLVVPTYSQPLRAYVTPPVPDDMASSPVCYIWGARSFERRLTLPRATTANQASGATKEVMYSLETYLYAIDDPNSPGVDQRFPVLVDSVTSTLRLAPIGIQMTDPTTGTVSSLLAIAEQVTTTYDYERLLADQRYVRFGALLVVTVQETFQG
jgi:hypothetical protein